MTQYNWRPRYVPPVPVVIPPPVAHFTVSSALLVSTFNDDSTGSVPITGWAWNFADAASGAANTSALQNPSHTFSGAGSYAVSLTVTDQNGQSSTPFIRTVTVAAAGNQPPNASFTLSVANLAVTVHDTSTDDVGIVTRDWNWGDGSAHGSTANPAAHTYPSDGAYTIRLTVTDGGGLTDFEEHVANVTTGDTTTRRAGWPYGPIGGGWSSTTVLSPDTDLFNCFEQSPGTASALRTRLTASDPSGLNVQNIFALTGGDHVQYFTDFGDGATLNPRFDRIKWNQKLEGGGSLGNGYGDSATKTAVANAVGGSLLGFDVCDEPNVDGGQDGNGNTWGPTGTMQKSSFNNLSRWHVVVSTSIAATSSPATVQCQAIQGCAPIPSGTKLVFIPIRSGIPSTVILAAQAAVGAVSISVTAIPRALVAGDVSNSNATDNMAAHMKHLFPTTPIGVTHRHNTFVPDQHYTVMDFLIDQYSWAKGEIIPWRDAGLALGVRDNHQIVFSLNVTNGGPQISGCPLGDTLTGSTGGQSGGSNCHMNATQILTWGRNLYAISSGRRAIGLLLWTYNQTYYHRDDIRTSFTTLKNELALLPKGSWFRTA